MWRVSWRVSVEGELEGVWRVSVGYELEGGASTISLVFVYAE